MWWCGLSIVWCKLRMLLMLPAISQPNFRRAGAHCTAAPLHSGRNFHFRREKIEKGVGGGGEGEGGVGFRLCFVIFPAHSTVLRYTLYTIQ